MAGPFTARELAEALGGRLEGDPERVVEDLRGLDDAGPEHASFLANPRYARRLGRTRAGVLLLAEGVEAPPGATVIRCADPYAAFARALALFHPYAPPPPGVDPRAYIAEDAVVDGARVEAFAWIGPGAVVGPGTWVEAGAVVGAGARVGRDCRLMPHSVVAAGCEVGDRVWLNPGAVVGAEGFGFAPTPEGNVKIPQAGRAVVEDDVELGAHACVDRAAMGETRVRRGVKTDNFVQVGHAADVGEHSLLVAYAGVAGSSRVGRRAVLAARAAVLGHIRLGHGVRVGVASAVHDDQPDGAAVTGVPAIDHRRWLRAATAFARLPELAREVRALRRGLDELAAGRAGARGPATAPAAAGAQRTEERTMDGLDAQGLMALLPHRYPFLLIDRVEELEPGVRAVGIKCVSANEPYFQGHFPGQPIMPGVLIAEAFAQLAGVIALSAHPDYAGKAVYLMGLDRVRFRRPVRPGDRLVLTCEKLQEKRAIWRFAARAEVDGRRVAEAEVLATVADRPA